MMYYDWSDLCDNRFLIYTTNPLLLPSVNCTFVPLFFKSKMSTSATTEPSVEGVERYNTDVIAYLQNQQILNEQHINVPLWKRSRWWWLSKTETRWFGLNPGPAKRISDSVHQLNWRVILLLQYFHSIYLILIFFL